MRSFLIDRGVNLERAPDHETFVDRSGSQRALIRAPDHKKFVG